MNDNKDDIPFEDSPPRPERDVSGEAAGAADGADGKDDSEAAGPTASEERTPPGSGSTGPTGVREDLGTLADEARKLWSAIESRVVAPAVQSYPEVARHLGAAGREMAAAVRSAVRGSEQSWQTGGPGGDKAQEKITVERVDRIDPSEQKNRD